jgi:hypothetical protein
MTGLTHFFSKAKINTNKKVFKMARITDNHLLCYDHADKIHQ